MPLTKREQRQAEAKKTSLAAKIITRHKLKRQKYTKERLAWAYKIFAGRGGRARVQSMTPEQRHELAQKAGRASAKAREKQKIQDAKQKVLADLAEAVGPAKLRALLNNQ